LAGRARRAQHRCILVILPESAPSPDMSYLPMRPVSRFAGVAAPSRMRTHRTLSWAASAYVLVGFAAGCDVENVTVLVVVDSHDPSAEGEPTGDGAGSPHDANPDAAVGDAGTDRADATGGSDTATESSATDAAAEHAGDVTYEVEIHDAAVDGS